MRKRIPKDQEVYLQHCWVFKSFASSNHYDPDCPLTHFHGFTFAFHYPTFMSYNIVRVLSMCGVGSCRDESVSLIAVAATVLDVLTEPPNALAVTYCCQHPLLRDAAYRTYPAS